MKRYISISLAFTLIGLIKAEEVLTQDPVFLQDLSTLETANSARKFVSDKTEDLTRVNCLLFNDMTFFDLRSLENETPYQIGNHYFQFCRRLKAGDTKTFAYVENGALFTSQTVLTDGGRPVNVKAVMDEENPDAPRHISFEMDGGETCAFDSNRQYSVRYEITCDPEVVEKPSLDITNLDLLTD